MRRSQKRFTLLRIQFESANQKKNKFLAVTRATRDVILKKPRSSGDENDRMTEIYFHQNQNMLPKLQAIASGFGGVWEIADSLPIVFRITSNNAPKFLIFQA